MFCAGRVQIRLAHFLEDRVNQTTWARKCGAISFGGNIVSRKLEQTGNRRVLFKLVRVGTKFALDREASTYRCHGIGRDDSESGVQKLTLISFSDFHVGL